MNTITEQTNGLPAPSPLALPRDNGNPQPGQICLANEARFTSAYYSEPLTAYAVGWKDQQNIEATLDFLFPPVQVSRRFEYKKADNAEAFLSEMDEERAIGGEFKRVEYRGSTVNEKTLNKGLTIRVDLDQVGGMPNWREMHTSRLLQRLMRNELRRGLDLAITAATDTPKTWDTTAGKDPDAEILTDLIAGVDASGVRANRILFGEVAWNKRLLSHRAQTNGGGYASAGLNPVELAQFLGVEKLMVSRERYQSSSTLKSRLMGDVVLQFYALDGLTPDDPSHTKRFWSAAEGGGKFRVYEQIVSAKLVDVTVEHYSNVVITSNVGLRKLTIS
jgi:hypothetical protein